MDSRTKFILYRKREFENGFSLIELLVVISIIGLLSSLVLVGVKKSRVQSIHANSSVSLKTLKQAFQLYYQEHGDWPGAPANGNRMMVTNAAGQGWDQLMSALQPYISGKLYDLKYTIVNGAVKQGYMYYKGTDISPV